MRLEPTIHRLHGKYILLYTYTCTIRSVSIFLQSTTEIQQWMYKTSVLRIDYLWMYVISSPWVVKLWEFSFPKVKIKTIPFSWFREFAFPIEKIPFLAKWVRAWMYALVKTGGTGTGSPIGGSPNKFEPNPSSLYRNAWELLDQWWDSRGTATVGVQRSVA